MNYIAVVIGALGFLVVLVVTPWLIRMLKRVGMAVHDQNKEGRPFVPISGGLAVLAGVVFGFMVFVFYKTFMSYFNGGNVIGYYSLLVLFAGLLSLFIITLVGFLDDLVIYRNRMKSGGLRQWQKPLLTLAAAIPLMVIGAGSTEINFPIFNITVNFGILYPLLIIPFGVVFASNMVNMLAGINGMEVGMGIVYMGMLGLYSYANGRWLAALFALLIFSSLLAFWFYNKYPARILPGDSLTYLLGGGLAVIAIVGNIEKAVLIASIPFVVEFFLKLRSRFGAESYGRYSNGTVCRLGADRKIYSLTHLLLNKCKYTERQMCYRFMLMELVFCLLIWVV